MKRKSGEERKAEIIQSALDIASEEGAANVTTQAIADRVGIAQPTVFRHFKSKDAIFRAALEWVASNAFKLLETDLAIKSPPDKRLQNFISRQLFIVSKQKGIPRLLFSDRLHLENPSLKETVQRIIEKLTSNLSGLVQEGIEDGVFDPSIHPDEAARMIVAAIQGSVLRWSIYDFSYDLSEQGDVIWAFVRRALKAG